MRDTLFSPPPSSTAPQCMASSVFDRKCGVICICRADIPRTSQNPERALQYIYATNSQISLSQFDAIRQEYELSLYSGALDSWEQLYDEMLDKMRAAGSDRILEEIQRQVNEYLASA
jgi:hypothetical protein